MTLSQNLEPLAKSSSWQHICRGLGTSSCCPQVMVQPTLPFRCWHLALYKHFFLELVLNFYTPWFIIHFLRKKLHSPAMRWQLRPVIWPLSGQLLEFWPCPRGGQSQHATEGCSPHFPATDTSPSAPSLLPTLASVVARVTVKILLHML